MRIALLFVALATLMASAGCSKKRSDKPEPERPNDPRWLVKKADEALAGNNFDSALSAAGKAASLAANPKVEAAALDAMGRALQGKGDKAAAERAFRRSILLVPKLEVQQRLAKINGQTASDALTPLRMRGPYDSLDGYCAELKSEAERDAAWACNRDPHESIKGPTTSPPAGPMSAVRIFELGTDTSADCHLGVKTARGWYATGLLPGCRGPNQLVEMKELGMAQVSDSGLIALFVKHESKASWKDVDAPSGSPIDVESNSAYMSMCAVGESGTPSCTPPFVTHVEYTAKGEAVQARSELTITPAMKPGLVLELSTKNSKIFDSDAQALLGEHSLTFP